MELERKHIEAIKYRLEKQGLKATHGQIKLAALNFETLDIDAIADRVAHDITYKSTQITSNSSSNQITRLPLPPDSKGSLVKIEAAQLGITLSDDEVIQIIESSNQEITDTAQFLIEIRECLREFLYQKRQEEQQKTTSLVGTISDVLNEDIQEKARANAETNQTLTDLFTDYKSQATATQSQYRTRISSIREMLQASKSRIELDK